jgi:hypothetical protein
MGHYIPICLADFFAIKAIAFLAFGVIVLLYWSGVKEKRAQRRERKWLEDKRRELREKGGNKPQDP